MPCVADSQHHPGNLAVLLRSAPTIVKDGTKSDSKAFWALVLVTPEQKSGKSGALLMQLLCLELIIRHQIR